MTLGLIANWSEYDLVYTFMDRPLLETGGGPMDNKRYTLEEKIKFLDALEKKGTDAWASTMMMFAIVGRGKRTS